MKSPADSVILTYHSIDNSGSVISTPTDIFVQQMELLAEGDWRVTSIEEAIRSPGKLAITFDDGYSNFLAKALPVLERYSFPSTVFVVPGRCGLDNQWRGSADRVPVLPLMSLGELREISAHGARIGGHTMTHPVLTNLHLTEAEAEIRDCRRILEDQLLLPVEDFAYPYGVCNSAVKSIASKHFLRACGTRMGFTEAAAQRFDLPRIDAHYLRNPRWFERFAHGEARPYLAARRALREFKGWATARTSSQQTGSGMR